MDVGAAWAKIGPTTKAMRTFSAERINTALDAASVPFADFAEWWDAEADRRRKLRTPENLTVLRTAAQANTEAVTAAADAVAQRAAARAATPNPFAAERRATATLDRAARKDVGRTRAELATAQANYPAPLIARAVQFHAAHGVPASLASLALGTPWPVTASGLVIASNVAGVLLGRRAVPAAPVVDDGLSAEERALMGRLQPEHWKTHADGRGLGGTLTARPAVTDAGIVCAVRLDGKWTVSALADRLESVRALLGARTGLRIEVTSGPRGGWALLTLRTRSAVDGADLLWTPGRAGIGMDTGTGQIVQLPHGRKLIAGTSGAGKSVLLRAILAPYVLDPLSTVIYIDAKGEESALWAHCAREAINPEDIAEVVAEVVAEMLERRDEMRARRIATWQATEQRPRLVVLVDEGAD